MFHPSVWQRKGCFAPLCFCISRVQHQDLLLEGAAGYFAFASSCWQSLAGNMGWGRREKLGGAFTCWAPWGGGCSSLFLFRSFQILDCLESLKGPESFVCFLRASGGWTT